MAEQLACLFSTIEQDSNVWQPVFVGQLQSGERFSGSIENLPDGSTIPVVKDFSPSANDLDTAAGLTICYVYADETRITAGDGLSQYHVLWRMYADAPHTTTQMPGDNMTGAELSAIQTYLETNTPYSASQISNWLQNKFEVASQQAAVTWATGRPRTATVSKLMQAMQIWSEAKAELEAV